MIEKALLAALLIAGLTGRGFGQTEKGSGMNGKIVQAIGTEKILSVDSEKKIAMKERGGPINPEGKTLGKRIRTPEGYRRIRAKKGSFQDFLRKYPMKPDGSPVLLYDGSEKGNQSAHAAVFSLPLEAENLQQCSDSIQRMYGEYFYKNKNYGKIRFELGTDFVADFSTWSRGHGIVVQGNRISWGVNAKNDTGYPSFRRFMRMVFAYSGTLTMERASKKIRLKEARAGDIFIRGGSPGHVVMIADVCRRKDGKKAYLLAQGYMPAQEFHILKHPEHTDDPWYYEEEMSFPLSTPEYGFSEGSLRRYR